MALRHRELAVEGVQFHPESVLTEGGHRLLANWLGVCGDGDAVGRSAGLAPGRPPRQLRCGPPLTQGLGGGALEDGGGELDARRRALEDGGGAARRRWWWRRRLGIDDVDVLPRASSVPPGGFVEMTSPAARVASSLDCLLVSKPAFVSCVVASAMLSPVTSGTFTRPEATLRETLVPGATAVPVEGLESMTVPLSSSRSSTLMTGPRESPGSCNACWAAA